MGLDSRVNLRVWQIVTVLLLVVGYSGYYLCRSNLSVVAARIVDELQSKGVEPADAKVRIGLIMSLGTLGYAVGKFLTGIAGDYLGGRRNFLGGMAGAVFFTVLFALGGGFPVFTLAWIGNRLVQSAGWSGMLKVSGRWFSYTSHGSILGVLSLSYLFGDAAAKAFMAELIGAGLGWRSIFLINAGILAGWFLLCLRFLKESPRAIGAEEGTANPLNVYGQSGNDPSSVGLLALIRPLVTSTSFWCVCLLSLALTLLRETFNNWTPLYFEGTVNLPPRTAAYVSAGFSFLGGCSVLLAGFLGDVLGKTGRAIIIVVGILLTSVALGLLSQTPPDRVLAGVVLVLLTGFLLIGPYSYLGGAVALDFGGKRGGATACGMIDGVGYLAGWLAGDSVARVVREWGWPTAFAVLAGVALASCAVAAVYWFLQTRPTQPLSES